MRQNNRIIVLDQLKGLGILFMIIGHIEFAECINKYIYSFHMPLFFVVSGYVYKKSTLKFEKYIKIQAKLLLVPYLVCGIFFSIIFYLSGHSFNVEKVFRNFVFPNKYPFDWCGAIWFLMAIFIVKIIFEAINRIRIAGVRNFILIFLIASGWVIAYKRMKLPLCIDTALIALGLYLIGYLCRLGSCVITERLKRGNEVYFFLAICFGISMLCFANETVNMRENQYGNLGLFYLSGLAGIISWLLIFYIADRKKNIFLKKLVFLSDNSIVYMELNQFIIAIFNVLVLARFESLAIQTLLKLIEVIFTVGIIAVIAKTLGKNSKLKIIVGK